MKNIKRIVLTFAMLFFAVLATACSNNRETATKTYALEDSSLKTTQVFTYIEKEDKIIKQVTISEGTYAEFQPGKTKEEIIEMIEPITKKFEGIKGIKYSIDYKDESFVETIEIDYENLDYEKAKVALDEEFQDPSKGIVSMKITEKALLEDGYVEQK